MTREQEEKIAYQMYVDALFRVDHETLKLTKDVLKELGCIRPPRVLLPDSGVSLLR